MILILITLQIYCTSYCTIYSFLNFLIIEEIHLKKLRQILKLLKFKLGNRDLVKSPSLKTKNLKIK